MIRAACAVAALVFVLAASGCENALSLESYEQITVDMSQSEVETILGVGEEQTASGTDISAGGLVSGSGSESGRDRTFLWKADHRQIVVNFRDGKVLSKSQQGLE